MQVTIGGVVVLSLVLLIWWLLGVGRRESHLPHGPPTVPVLGNLNIFPTSQAHLRFTEWARIYGGIYSLKISHKTAVVLTDMGAVREVMETQSHMSADRPPICVADFVTGGIHIGLSRYNKNWRVQRRLVHELLAQSACNKYIPIQEAESRQLALAFLHDPKNFYMHISRYSFSVILSILFGKRAPHPKTRDISDFYKMEKQWHGVLAPGAVPPIELLPFLKYIPKMFAQWKAEAESVRDMQREIYSRLLDEVREQSTSGTQTGCFMEQILARQDSADLSDSQLSYLGGALIEGSAGTTTAWIKFFVMAMGTHPDVQRKAHDELDRVIGNARMPKLGDLASLPYIQAIIKEVHRWRPIGPLAIPHATLGDIYYQRYRIPPETTLFMNVWGISHDADRYDRPEEFWPDRWIQHKHGLKHDSTHPNSNPPWFGAGKRACPGANLAQNSLAIATMTLLWGFSFQPELDKYTGKPIEINTFSFSEGLEMSPEPFRCQISPRSSYHADIIEHEFAAEEAELKQYELEPRVE